MRLSNTMIFIAPFLLFGCQSYNKQQYEGHFVYGSELSDFRPCGTKNIFWLGGEPEKIKIIQQASSEKAEKAGEPYQEIYVKFSGFIENREPIGFEEGTEGLIYMTELLNYSFLAPDYCK